MSKLMSFFSRKRNITFIFTAVVIFIICIKFLTIDYEVNDDYVYCRIMSGSYSGEPSAMSVYEGYLFGLFVSWLYSLIPNFVEWYIIVFHTLYIFAYIVITNKLLTSKTSDLIKYISAVTFSIIQLYLLICPQFTILAGELALAAGVCLIGRPSKSDILLSIIFVFLSSQIRIQSLLMVIVAMMPLLFFPIKLKGKAYWTKPAFLFGAIILALAINHASNRVYTKDADWKYYTDYNKPRGIIEQNSLKFEAAEIITDSIKKKEYLNLCKTRLIDGHYLSIDEMNECAEYLQSSHQTFLKNNLLPYLYTLNSYGFYLVAIGFLYLLVVAIRRKDWNTILIIILTGAIFLLELGYCMITSWVKGRIIICLMMYLYSVAAVCTYKTLRGRQLMTCVIAVSAILSYTFLAKSYHWEKRINDRLKSTEKVNEVMASLQYQKMFVIGIPPYAEAYHVCSTPLTNKTILHGWLNNNPLHKNYYQGYESLVDRIPVVISHNAYENISDIRKALSQKGIATEENTLYSDADFRVVLLCSVEK